MLIRIRAALRRALPPTYWNWKSSVSSLALFLISGSSINATPEIVISFLLLD
jgi:hypothetical protein